jgi:hypothetical protein
VKSSCSNAQRGQQQCQKIDNTDDATCHRNQSEYRSYDESDQYILPELFAVGTAGETEILLSDDVDKIVNDCFGIHNFFLLC